MERLALVRVGELSRTLMEQLAAFLTDATGLACHLASDVVDPAAAYVASRGQFDSRLLLPTLEEIAGRGGSYALGVTDVDIFSAVFTFVFGEAQLGGPAGIVSIHRLQPTEYGLPDDPALFQARARKEALHETGHLLGLVHCRNPNCVMYFSPGAEEIDLKRDALCAGCRSTLDSTRG